MYIMPPFEVRLRLARIFRDDVRQKKIWPESVAWIATKYEEDYKRCLETSKDITKDEQALKS